MLKVVLFVVAILGAIFVAPMAASAVSYTPGAQLSASTYTPKTCDVVTVSADAGFFAPNEAVRATISGADSAATTWAGSTVGASVTGTSSATGAFEIKTKVADTATGSYTVSLESPSASGQLVFTVVAGRCDTNSGGNPSNPSDPTDPANPSNPTGSGSQSNPSSGSGVSLASLSTSGLATTGTSVSGAIIWGAAGLIALGIALVVVRAMIRKETRSAA